jgi:hypothetical protein
VIVLVSVASASGVSPGVEFEFVARQVGVEPAEFRLYEWAGRTIEYHRAQIRAHLGFRECSVADAEQLTQWLAAAVCEAERRPDLVRDELLGRCRTEPPSAGRIVRSALHQAEQTLTTRLAARLPAEIAGRLRALVAVGVPDDDAGKESVPALIKSVPGNVSLESMLTEIRKLRATRAIGLPGGLFADVAPRVLAGWRARAMVESPSHLRDHPAPLMLTLLPETVRRFDASAGDARLDAALAEHVAQVRVVVSLVGMQLVRASAAGTASRPTSS